MRLAPYAALAGRALEANFRRPTHPYKLTFCITYWCNYRCETCNIWQMKPRDELKLDEIQRVLPAARSDFLWVDLTGGEVYAAEGLRRRLRRGHRPNCKNLLLLHFPTNGYLTDKIVAGTREIRQHGGRRSSSSPSRPTATRR